jgi:predicted membrane protein
MQDSSFSERSSMGAIEFQSVLQLSRSLISFENTLTTCFCRMGFLTVYERNNFTRRLASAKILFIFRRSFNFTPRTSPMKSSVSCPEIPFVVRNFIICVVIFRNLAVVVILVPLTIIGAIISYFVFTCLCFGVLPPFT